MTTSTTTPTTTTTPNATVFLIDLPSLAYPAWHMAASDPDPNATSTQVLARVRALTAGFPAAAVCCDSPKSFRRALDPTYKAQRKAEDRAPLYHQMALVTDALRAEGYPVWEVEGFEADDVIASATAKALQVEGAQVVIASADKDLLALVSDRVAIKSLKDGSLIGPDEVVAKFGVRPDQITDYLCLVGDASDNVKGAPKIGPVTAAKLLASYGSLQAVYDAWVADAKQFTPAIAASLASFLSRADDVRALILLRTDAPVPFEEIAVDRQPPPFDVPTEPTAPEPTLTVSPAAQAALDAVAAALPTQTPLRLATSRPAAPEAPEAPPAPVVEAETVEAAPVSAALALRVDADYVRQLEPRSMGEAIQLAKYAFESRQFGAYGAPQAILMTVLAGRELGMPTMHALRAFHIVDGKPVLAADAIRALVLRSGLARSFRCTERTAARATFVTQRGDEPEISLTYTIEEATTAGLLKAGSGWVKNPADMLVARAGSKLARLVYPDVVHGIYAGDEQ